MALDQINPITPITPVKFDDPLEKYQNVLKAQYLQDEIAKDRREESDSTAFSNALKTPGAIDANGNVVSSVASNALVSAGQGKQVPKFLQIQATIAKSNAEAGASTAKAGKDDADAVHRKLQDYSDAFADINKNDPHLGQQDFYRKSLAMSDDPQILKLAGVKTKQEYMDYAMQQAWQAGQDPKTWATFVDDQQLGAQKSADHALAIAKLNKPQLSQVNLGDKHVVLSTVPGEAPQQVWEGQEGKNPNARGTTVNVTNLPAAKGQTAYEVTRDKQQAMHDDALFQAADSAKHNYEIGQKIKTLVNSGAITGAGADLRIDATAALKTLGLPVTGDQLANSQLLRKYLAQNLPSMLQQFKNAGVTRITNLDTSIAKDGSPQINMDPVALNDLADEIMSGAQEIAKKARDRKRQLPYPGVGETNYTLGITADIPIPGESAPIAKGTAKTHQDVAREFGFGQ